jgi:site-specific DNA-methyltransferase (adenine-specific)
LSRIETIGDCTLYLGDCREILPTLGKVDAVVTDPPYGVGLEYESYVDTQEALEELITAWVPAARKIAQRVVFTSGIQTMWLYPQPTWVMCWAISGAGSLGKWGFNCWQPIICYGPDPFLKNSMGGRPDLLFVNETSEKNGHPCPKPAGFMQRLVARASIDGESVMDPFMGSGTTGVAAVKLGREFVGIELEPKYFDIACRRIEDATRRPDMFIELDKRAKEIQQALPLETQVAE